MAELPGTTECVNRALSEHSSCNAVNTVLYGAAAGAGAGIAALGFLLYQCSIPMYACNDQNRSGGLGLFALGSALLGAASWAFIEGMDRCERQFADSFQRCIREGGYGPPEILTPLDGAIPDPRFLLERLFVIGDFAPGLGIESLIASLDGFGVPNVTLPADLLTRGSHT